MKGLVQVGAEVNLQAPGGANSHKMCCSVASGSSSPDILRLTRTRSVDAFGGRLHWAVMRLFSRLHPIQGIRARPDGTSVPGQEPSLAPPQGLRGYSRLRK